MKKRQFQGRIVAELLKNYAKKVPVCRHFMQCGGCSMQDFAYSDQLIAKKEKVGELFTDYIPLADIEIFARDEFEYRTRMDFVVTKDCFGLRQKRSFDRVVDLQECHLIANRIFLFLRKIYQQGIELGLEPYRPRDNDGFWRYLSLRINENNQVMLIFVTGQKNDDQQKYLKQLIEWIEENKVKNEIDIKSIYWLVNPTKSDVNFGEVAQWWGDQYLCFDIHGQKIAIGPNNFFQNNLSLFQKLLARVLDEINSDDRVLDLYCGVGTFSLPVAKKCNKVFGVEVVDESIVLARENADHNFIENAEFTTGQVHEWLTENAQLLKEYNVILLDPPRVGLEKAIDDIMARDFEKIIYVSCNPLALQKDLQILSEKYEVKQLSLWDLYPQTPHIETVAVLNNVKSIK